MPSWPAAKKSGRWRALGVLLLLCGVCFWWDRSMTPSYRSSEATAAEAAVFQGLLGGKEGAAIHPQAKYYCHWTPRRVVFTVYNVTNAESQDVILSIIQ